MQKLKEKRKAIVELNIKCSKFNEFRDLVYFRLENNIDKYI